MNKYNLKKYNLEDALIKISKIMFNIFDSDEKRIVYRKCYFGGFTFVELIYLLIQNSNDYKRQVITDDELYKFANNLYFYSEKLPETTGNEANFLLCFTFGSSQDQFRYQELEEFTHYQRVRSSYIFNILFKKYNIDCQSIIKNKFGIELVEFNNYLIVLMNLFKIETVLTEEILIKKYKPIFLKKNFPIKVEKILKFLDYYSKDYSHYRNSILNQREILVNPIIKTDKNNYILVNPFALCWKLGDGIYWILRNHYKNTKGNEYTQVFGMVYEDYVEVMLKKKLKKEQFIKLDPYKEKKTSSLADWIILGEKFNLIIEQKSSLAADSLKYGIPNVENLNNFLNKLKKAYFQLEKTEQKKLNDSKKINIKCILHYEYLPVKEFAKIEMERDLEIKDLDYYILISTTELEILIHIFSENEALFNIIIEEKIQLEKEKNSALGTRFMQIFEKYEIINNLYIREIEKELKDICKEAYVL